MSYCDFSDVRAIVDTDITDIEITDLITGLQAIQDLWLAGGGPNASVRKEILRLFVAIRCMEKDPNAMALGELREDRGIALVELKKDLKDMIRAAYGGISARYSYEQLPILT